MDPEVQAFRDTSLAAGWTVQTVTNEAGRVVHQIYNAAGEYVASGITPEKAWKRVFLRQEA